MTSLGERIKKIRGKMTQKEFSELLGITQRAVINYEISGRIPRKKILKAICEQFEICEQWLLTGEGPMYKIPEGTTERRGGDMSPVLSAPSPAQPIENITSKKNKTGDMSPVSSLTNETQELYRKILGLQERLLSLTEQNADLRIQLERRDVRIRELEKENSELREARKGIARLSGQARLGDV